MKNVRVFYLKIFQVLEVKFSIYLDSRVFVMVCYVVLVIVFRLSWHFALAVFERLSMSGWKTCVSNYC